MGEVSSPRHLMAQNTNQYMFYLRFINKQYVYLIISELSRLKKNERGATFIMSIKTKHVQWSFVDQETTTPNQNIHFNGALGIINHHSSLSCVLLK